MNSTPDPASKNTKKSNKPILQSISEDDDIEPNNEDKNH